jgi:hypothetical protein
VRSGLRSFVARRMKEESKTVGELQLWHLVLCFTSYCTRMTVLVVMIDF